MTLNTDFATQLSPCIIAFPINPLLAKHRSEVKKKKLENRVKLQPCGQVQRFRKLTSVGLASICGARYHKQHRGGKVVLVENFEIRLAQTKECLSCSNM